MLPVVINDKWFYINRAGEIAIKPAFDDANSFSDGVAAVQIGSKWGYIDKTGKIIISLQFNRASGFSEGLAAVELGGKWGYIDKQGKVVIGFQFDNAGYFINGLAPVLLDTVHQYTNPERTGIEHVGNRWAYIDKTGKVILKVDGLTDQVGDFINGVAKVEFKDKSFGYIDKAGKYIWGPTK